MPDIKDSVGDGGTNDDHDVAIVQAMLVLVKNAKNQSYLASYDGIYGKLTKGAIIAFQKDKLPAAPPPAGADTAGLVKKNNTTIKALSALLPAGFKELHVMEGGRHVYLPGTNADMLASKKSVTNDALLEANFRTKVGLLIEEMYKEHKIVLKIAGAKGRRRTYQDQYDLTLQVTAKGAWVTGAGPGESNHNYGRAVDIGLKGLSWLKRNGVARTDETAWLHKLTAVSQAQALLFWEAMRKVATNGKAKLFRGPVGDRPHIQAWDDAQVSMTKRLAVHLNNVGQMKWERGNQGARFRNYKADLGLGGAKYGVGSAQDIWKGKSPATKADYAAAKWAAAKKAAAPGQLVPPVTAAGITAKDMKNLGTALKADFIQADQNWKTWKPQ